MTTPDRSNLGRHSRRAIALMDACCQEGQLILDAGAGNSPYRDFLPGNVVGIDIRTTPLVDVQASLDGLPFPDELFDGVACYQVLFYRRDPVPWLKEIHRVMKRGGWFALSVSRPKAVHRERTWMAPSRPCATGRAGVGYGKLCCWACQTTLRSSRGPSGAILGSIFFGCSARYEQSFRGAS